MEKNQKDQNPNKPRFESNKDQFPCFTQDLNKKNTKMAMRPDDHRRKWDKKEYERKALDRIYKDQDGDKDGKRS